MVVKLPFLLHVSSQLGFPIHGEDFVQYSAPNVIKLEIGALIEIPLGVSISSCDTHGKIMVELDDKYSDSVQITKNIFNPYYKGTMNVRLYNTSNQYIRINPNEKVFKYTWIQNKGPKSTEIGVITDKIIITDKSTQTEPTPAPIPVAQPEPTPVSTPVAQPEPTPVSTPVAQPVSIPEPIPSPVSEPVSVAQPVSIPEPISLPVSEPTPEPVSEPTPEPIPSPVSEPMSEPTSESVSVPMSVSTPEPTPVSIPEPTSESVSVPMSVSAPVIVKKLGKRLKKRVNI
jgi:hypothetical protein